VKAVHKKLAARTGWIYNVCNKAFYSSNENDARVYLTRELISDTCQSSC